MRKILFLALPLALAVYFAPSLTSERVNPKVDVVFVPETAVEDLNTAEFEESQPIAQAVSVTPKAPPKKDFSARINERSVDRIMIPSIGVDAHIESVGLTPAGAMDSPAGPDNAGWYQYGPKPGEVGSAVIDGHSGWRDNIPAIFDNLGKVKIGDRIYIKNDDGTTIEFVVKNVKEYNYNADPSEIFHSNDGLAHLNLITCAGEWNDISKSSSMRLVVFADKI